MRGRGKTESVDTWMTSNWSAAVSFGSNLLEQNVKEKHMCMYVYMYMYMCCLLLSNKYKGLSRLHCKYIHWSF